MALAAVILLGDATAVEERIAAARKLGSISLKGEGKKEEGAAGAKKEELPEKKSAAEAKTPAEKKEDEQKKEKVYFFLSSSSVFFFLFFDIHCELNCVLCTSFIAINC